VASLRIARESTRIPTLQSCESPRLETAIGYTCSLHLIFLVKEETQPCMLPQWQPHTRMRATRFRLSRTSSHLPLAQPRPPPKRIYALSLGTGAICKAN
jgi:hypothetical protein